MSVLTKKIEDRRGFDTFQEYYRKRALYSNLPERKFPNTKDVRGSNYCDIGVKVNESDGRAVIVTAIDNLVKGASGEAVQNMNIMLGISRDHGARWIAALSVR